MGALTQLEHLLASANQNARDCGLIDCDGCYVGDTCKEQVHEHMLSTVEGLLDWRNDYKESLSLYEAAKVAINKYY